jgi:hypothetical protein
VVAHRWVFVLRVIRQLLHFVDFLSDLAELPIHMRRTLRAKIALSVVLLVLLLLLLLRQLLLPSVYLRLLLVMHLIMLVLVRSGVIVILEVGWRVVRVLGIMVFLVHFMRRDLRRPKGVAHARAHRIVLAVLHSTVTALRVSTLLIPVMRYRVPVRPLHIILLLTRLHHIELVLF